MPRLALAALVGPALVRVHRDLRAPLLGLPADVRRLVRPIIIPSSSPDPIITSRHHHLREPNFWNVAGHPTGRPGHAVGYPQEMDEGYAMASVAGFPADFRIKARDKFGDDRPYGADFFYVDLTQLCESDEPGHRCRKDAEGEYAPVYFWRESMDLDQRFNPDLEDELASPGACPSAHHSPRTLNWTGACPLVNSSAVLGALCSSASCKIETTGGTLCHQPSILGSLSIGQPNPHDGRHTCENRFQRDSSQCWPPRAWALKFNNPHGFSLYMRILIQQLTLPAVL